MPSRHPSVSKAQCNGSDVVNGPAELRLHLCGHAGREGSACCCASSAGGTRLNRPCSTMTRCVPVWMAVLRAISAARRKAPKAARKSGSLAMARSLVFTTFRPTSSASVQCRPCRRSHWRTPPPSWAVRSCAGQSRSNDGSRPWGMRCPPCSTRAATPYSSPPTRRSRRRASRCRCQRMQPGRGDGEQPVIAGVGRLTRPTPLPVAPGSSVVPRSAGTPSARTYRPRRQRRTTAEPRASWHLCVRPARP